MTDSVSVVDTGVSLEKTKDQQVATDPKKETKPEEKKSDSSNSLTSMTAEQAQDIIAKLLQKRKGYSKDREFKTEDFPMLMDITLSIHQAFASIFSVLTLEAKRVAIDIMLNPEFPAYKLANMKAELGTNDLAKSRNPVKMRNVFAVMKAIFDVLPVELYNNNIDKIWDLFNEFLWTDWQIMGNFWNEFRLFMNAVMNGQEATLITKTQDIFSGKISSSKS